MNLALVGCGFVADFYLKTLANYPHLTVIGVMDRDRTRADRFAKYYDLSVYDTLEDVTSDERVQIVLNLTNPGSHYDVSRACLLAGKHVYSEKPLATSYEQAEELAQLAIDRSVHLSGAPCGVLGEAAQTAWAALRNNVIGKVRLVYAELDDGMIHRMNYRRWSSVSGSPWPWKDEFEVGCTLEHAGYYLTWLVAFFGPVVRVTSFASVTCPDKSTDTPVTTMAPDFTTAALEFASGVIARLTCSIVAPHDHQLKNLRRRRRAHRPRMLALRVAGVRETTNEAGPPSRPVPTSQNGTRHRAAATPAQERTQMAPPLQRYASAGFRTRRERARLGYQRTTSKPIVGRFRAPYH